MAEAITYKAVAQRFGCGEKDGYAKDEHDDAAEREQQLGAQGQRRRDAAHRHAVAHGQVCEQRLHRLAVPQRLDGSRQGAP